MATTYSGTFNTNPYYDDFDETKNYHRILFRPGYAVQARELTQLQTQIQDQINKFGKHVFVNGSVVAGGGTSFESNLLSIKLNSTYSGTSIDVTDFNGKTIVGSTSGTKAIVKDAAELTSTDPITLLVKVISGTEFTLGEDITVTEGSTVYTARIQSVGAFNTGMIYSINSGVFFIDGKFVYVEPQNIILDKYSNTSSKKIGFNVQQTIVNSDDDESLLDGSLGTSNYAAPGGDRYTVTLTLSSQDLGFIAADSLVAGEQYKIETVGTTAFTSVGADSNTVGTIFTATGATVGTGTATVYSTDFVEICRVVDGQQVVTQLKTLYSELGKELAARTFDESGDYTVKAWPIQVSDSQDILSTESIVSGTHYTIISVGDTDFTSIGATSNTVGVTFLSTGTTTGTGTVINEDKFSISLDPGKAYVKGYEFKTDNQTVIEIDKARTDSSISSSSVSVNYGNYVYVNTLSGELYGNVTDLANSGLSSGYTTVELHDTTTVAGSSSKLGTANVRFLSKGTGDPGLTATIYNLYLFNITMDSGKYFKNLESVISFGTAGVTGGSFVIGQRYMITTTGGTSFTTIGASANTVGVQFTATGTGTGITGTATEILGKANISDLSKIGNTSGGDVVLSGTDSPGLVFPLNNTYIKTVKDTSDNDATIYTIQRTYKKVASGVSPVVINTLDASEAFEGTAGAVVSDLNLDAHYHVVLGKVTNNGGVSGYTSGSIVDFSDGTGGKYVELSAIGTSQSASFYFTGVSSSFSAEVYITVTVNVNSQAAKTKTLSGYKGVVIQPTLNTTAGGTDSLQISDIYDVLAVYNTDTVNPSSASVNSTTGAVSWPVGVTTHNDVTSNYTLDNGQRAEFYDHGKLVLTGTAPSSSQYLYVVYRDFTHSGVSRGYFSIDSYTNSGLNYSEYPVFNDPASGISYNLRDCIDFRPKRDPGANTFSGGQVPTPTESLLCDYSYYLGRFDKIIATPDKQFIVQRGTPSVNPVVPVDETNGMTIYVLGIVPYTSDVKDIQVKYVDNKRYTMRDIGKLEKRVKNLEYYTQLSLLEKQAKDTSIPDSSNYEKFKNGFAVDPFSSADIFAANAETWTQRRWAWWSAWFNGGTTLNAGATNYSQNSIADVSNIDFNAAIDPVNAELRAPFTVENHDFEVSTLTDTERNGDLVTLTYTETTAISQPLATSYVNINPFNVIKFFGTVTLEPSFDRWIETNYLPAVNKIVDVRIPDSEVTGVSIVDGGGSLPISRRPLRLVSSTISDSDVVIGSATSSLGTNVVDIQYIPYIRESVVTGIGKSFKPLAQLYGFMDGTAVTNRMRPLTRLTIQYTSTTSAAGSKFNDTQGIYEVLDFRTVSPSGSSTGSSAKTALFSQAFSTDSTRHYLTVFNEDGAIAVGQYVVGLTSGTSAVITAIDTYALGDAMVPDEYGNIGFEFDIPAATFKTGERTLRLIDNSTNDVEIQESIGEAKYTAQGIVQTKQETILTTRTMQRQRVNVQVFAAYDPTAQTFFVDPRTYPNGMHISAADVFFKSKSATVPVEMQIRRTVNGYPSSMHDIPFAEVSLNAADVVTSTTGTTPTTFNFVNPIHLAPGEYALVLLSNSNEYQVYVAEMQGTLLDGSGRVDKQPYIGSLFQSQNSSTWTADQNKDLKFTIRRAVFDPAGYAQFDIVEPLSVKDYQTLFVNSSTISPIGTNIAWEAKAWYGGLVYDSEWKPIDMNQDINYQALKAVGSRDDSVTYPALRLRATLTTTDDAVSPVIDASSINAVVALNSINNDSTGESGVKQGGNAIAKYVTKPINLNSGFEATNINVTFDAYKPSGTNVKVYYKTLPFEKNTSINEESWVEMDIETAPGYSGSQLDYREHRYFPTGAIVNFIPQNNPITQRFNTFQIKIVLLSNNEAITPKIRDLRIIALDN